MSISQYVSIPVFLISFIVGIVSIFLFGPETKTVRMYPSLDNYQDLIYQDNASQCFSMSPVAGDCPSNAAEIQDVPMQ
jgi:hypothetical protein